MPFSAKLCPALSLSFAALAIASAAEQPAKQETQRVQAAPHQHHGSADASAAWFETSALPAPKPSADLGNHHYAVTTSNAEAQRFFDQGLVFAYGFNHLEALRAFRHAQSLDPKCAMCFWGEAYVLGPNLNLPMDDAAAPVSRRAISRAAMLAEAATPKEKALISAMQARYGEGVRANLDRSYANAAVAVAKQFPDDPDIATLAAKSLMLLSPWDYWTDNGKTAKSENTTEALLLLEGALARTPSHITAIHFYIHLVEASDNPHRAEPYADKLRSAVPAAGHLVHMPGHIYSRTGKYRDAMAVNRDAAPSDERYIADNPAVGGPYARDLYPHNVHFYLTSALMLGQGDEAMAAAEKLARIARSVDTAAAPPIQPIMQAPYFAFARFAAPAAILDLPKPRDDKSLVLAGWHYARGIAYALQGNADTAATEAAAIDALAARDLSAFDAAQVPAKSIMEIAAHLVRAKAAAATGNLDDAQRHAQIGRDDQVNPALHGAALLVHALGPHAGRHPTPSPRRSISDRLV